MVRKVFLVPFEEVRRGGVSLWLTKVSTNAPREINSLSLRRLWRSPFDSDSGTSYSGEDPRGLSSGFKKSRNVEQIFIPPSTRLSPPKLSGTAVSRLDQSRVITMPWQCGFGDTDVVTSGKKTEKKKIHLNCIIFASFIYLFIYLLEKYAFHPEFGEVHP